MSHFLNKLARQTLGPSEAIQPRVPSIYEPYRRAGVPEWAEPAARERGPAPADEIGSEASADVESIRAAESRPQEVHREEVRGRVPLPRHADVAQEMQHTDGLELPLRSALATPVSPDRERTRRSAPESRPLSAVVRRSQVERIETAEQPQKAVAIPVRNAGSVLDQAIPAWPVPIATAVPIRPCAASPAPHLHAAARARARALPPCAPPAAEIPQPGCSRRPRLLPSRFHPPVPDLFPVPRALPTPERPLGDKAHRSRAHAAGLPRRGRASVSPAYSESGSCPHHPAAALPPVCTHGQNVPLRPAVGRGQRMHLVQQPPRPHLDLGPEK